MDPGLLFGIALLVLTLVGVAIALIATWASGQIQWKRTPSWNVKYIAELPFKPEHLDNALTLAVSKLRPVWPLTATTLVAHNTKFIVQPVPEWTDIWGRKIAGSSSGQVVTVGSDLAALCHELAHRCEWELDGRTDDAHVSWTSRGIHAAIDQYAAELKGVL